MIPFHLNVSTKERKKYEKKATPDTWNTKVPLLLYQLFYLLDLSVACIVPLHEAKSDEAEDFRLCRQSPGLVEVVSSQLLWV